MNHSSNPQTSTWSATALAKMALVTALYVVVTVLLAPLSFGPIQLRLAELFNYLGVFNKRYIWSITLGVAIANAASPLGIIDIVIGRWNVRSLMDCLFCDKKSAKFID